LFLTDSKIERATDADLPAIAGLAGVIWRQHYPGIISREHINYMLKHMFDLNEMRSQSTVGFTYEKLINKDQLIGFASHGPAENSAEHKLDKLYVHPDFQGRGFGGKLLEHVVEFAKNREKTALILAVNKQNKGAIAMYRRMGFKVRESVVNNIGNGFVMDDYIMMRSL